MSRRTDTDRERRGHEDVTGNCVFVVFFCLMVMLMMMKVF